VALHDRDVHVFNTAIQEGDDRMMLKLFRDESTFVVLLVRQENDERREAWKAKEAK
jgi:hypothetical protein